MKIPRTESFDLILINVQLAEMNGLKLCEEIRNQGTGTPILLLSTLKQKDCCCIHNVEYMNKPFSIKDLLHQIKFMLTSEGRISNG